MGIGHVNEQTKAAEVLGIRYHSGGGTNSLLGVKEVQCRRIYWKR